MDKMTLKKKENLLLLYLSYIIIRQMRYTLEEQNVVEIPV